MSRKHIAAYVKKIRSIDKQITKDEINSRNSTEVVANDNLQNIKSKNKSETCEILTDLDLEHDAHDFEKYKYLKEKLNAEAILRSCKHALGSSSSGLAHIRYAKALYLVGNQRKRPVRPELDQPGMLWLFSLDEIDEIVEHTKIAVLKKDRLRFFL